MATTLHTLQQTLDLAKMIGFGPRAIEFLEKKIEENGPDDIVIDERGMIQVLKQLSGW